MWRDGWEDGGRGEPLGIVQQAVECQKHYWMPPAGFVEDLGMDPGERCSLEAEFALWAKQLQCLGGSCCSSRSAGERDPVSRGVLV